MKKRDSNIELLRIISMLAIVCFHCIQHAGSNNFTLLSDGGISLNWFFSVAIGIWGSIATLVFVAITSFFFSASNEPKIHISKIFSTTILCWISGIICVGGGIDSRV